MPSSNKKEYGKGWGGDQAFEDLECPSGVWCQIRKPNPQQLLSLGLIDNLDAFSGLVDKKHIKRVKGSKSSLPSVDAQKIMDNPRAIVDMMAVADKVIEYMVVQPEVRRPITPALHENGQVQLDENGKVIERPISFNDRDKSVIYTDQLDYIDKIWIFQYCAGGDGDLAKFREQIGQLDADVGDVDEMENTSV